MISVVRRYCFYGWVIPCQLSQAMQPTLSNFDEIVACCFSPDHKLILLGNQTTVKVTSIKTLLIFVLTQVKQHDRSTFKVTLPHISRQTLFNTV